MKKSSNSYNQLLKATSILASSQVVSLLYNFVRTKLVAVMLGPIGIGLIVIFQNFINVITSFSQLGLEPGAIKAISFAHAKSKRWRVARTIWIFRRWFLITAIIGVIFCISAAYPVSKYFFNNNSYVQTFMLLSVAVFFSIIAAGRRNILQGLREITYLAKTNVLESVFGLVVTVSIYFYMGEDGIVWAFIANSLVAFLLVNYFFRKTKMPKVKTDIHRIINTGVNALRLGIFVTIGACVSSFCLFLIPFLIDYFSSNKEALGLYAAAWGTAHVFAGFIITSAGTDYFARLCAIINKENSTRKLVNEQVYLLSLISTPMIITIILFSYYLLSWRYSSSFYGAQELLNWMMLGITLKLVTNPAASIFLAKQKGFIYLITELVFYGSYLTFCYILMPTYDYVGIGIAYLLTYIIYFCVVMLFAYFTSKLLWSWKTLTLVVSNIILILGAFYIAIYQSEHTLLAGITLVVISSAYSIYSLSTVFEFSQIKNWFNSKIN